MTKQESIEANQRYWKLQNEIIARRELESKKKAEEDEKNSWTKEEIVKKFREYYGYFFESQKLSEDEVYNEFIDITSANGNHFAFCLVKHFDDFADWDEVFELIGISLLKKRNKSLRVIGKLLGINHVRVRRHFIKWIGDDSD